MPEREKECISAAVRSRVFFSYGDNYVLMYKHIGNRGVLKSDRQAFENQAPYWEVNLVVEDFLIFPFLCILMFRIHR